MARHYNRYFDFASEALSERFYLDILQHNGISSWRSQFMGTFQPLFDIGRDFVATGKAYRNRYEILWDVIAPLRGIAHIVQGLFQLILGTILFTCYTIGLPFFLGLVSEYKASMALKFIAVQTSWFLNGIFTIFRGLTQIALFPLAWLRIPFRLFVIEPLHGKPLLETDEDLEEIIATVEETDWEKDNVVTWCSMDVSLKNRISLDLESLADYAHRIFKSGVRTHHEPTMIDYQEERARFAAIQHAPLNEKKDLILYYFDLFRPGKEPLSQKSLDVAKERQKQAEERRTKRDELRGFYLFSKHHLSKSNSEEKRLPIELLDKIGAFAFKSRDNSAQNNSAQPPAEARGPTPVKTSGPTKAVEITNRVLALAQDKDEKDYQKQTAFAQDVRSEEVDTHRSEAQDQSAAEALTGLSL